MTDEAAFLAAIAADPEDAAPRLVFADWLEEHDDPRGPWLRDPLIVPWMGLKCENPIPRLVAQLGEHEEREEFGCPVLARVGAPAIPALLEALRTPHDYRRRAICLTLKQLAAELEPFRPQIEEEAKSSDQVIRTAALAALGCLADNPAAQRVIELLERPDLPSRLAGLQSMGGLGVGGVPAIPHVLRLWQREAEERSGTEFRLAAATAFSRMGAAAADAVPTLIGALAHPVLAEEMTWVFESIGRVAIPALTAAMRTLDPVGGRLAAASLYRASRARFQVLANILADPETPNRPRRAILGLIGEGGIDEDENLISTVMTQLAHQEPSVRAAAAGALASLGPHDEPVLVALERLSRDQDSSCRIAALQAFTRASDEWERTHAVVRARLIDSEETVRKTAWDQYVASVQVSQAVGDLRSLDRSESVQIRYLALEGLGRAIGFEARAIEPSKSFFSIVEPKSADAASEQWKRDAIKGLLNALGDRSRSIRLSAMRILAACVPESFEEAHGPLVEALEESHPELREKAAQALARLALGSEPAVQKCLQLLRDEDTGVVCAALGFLGTVRKVQPEVDRRIKPFLRDRSSQIRGAAAWALSTHDGPPDDVLEDSKDLCDDPGENTRAAGLWLLTRFESHLLQESTLKRLRRGLRDSSPTVRSAVVAAAKDQLGNLARKLQNDLVRLLETEEQPLIVDETIAVLRKHCPERPSVLEKLLGNPSESIRLRAIRSLAGAGSAAVNCVPLLHAELQQGSESTRLLVLESLRGIGPEAAEIVPTLDAYIRSDDTLRGPAAHVAGTLGSAGAPLIPLLTRLWEDESTLGRDRVIQALAVLSSTCPAAIAPTKQGLEHPHPEAIRYVLLSLTGSGPADLVFLPDIVRLLGHADREVRVVAAMSLKHWGRLASPAVPALVERLDSDPEWWVKYHVVDTLAEIGPVSAIAIDRMIQTFERGQEVPEEGLLQLRCLQALRGLADPRSLEFFRKMLFHEDGVVREEAAHAIKNMGSLAAQAVPEICKALLDESWDLLLEDESLTEPDRRLILLDALRIMKPQSEDVRNVLEKKLYASTPLLRRRALEVLAVLGPEATPILRRALKHKDSHMRETARQELQRRGGN